MHVLPFLVLIHIAFQCFFCVAQAKGITLFSVDVLTPELLIGGNIRLEHLVELPFPKTVLLLSGRIPRRLSWPLYQDSTDSEAPRQRPEIPPPASAGSEF